jgi:hypothetical protein
MVNVSQTESNALWQLTQRQLKFPPLLTLCAGVFGVLAWNSFVFHPTDTLAQMFRDAIPFWAAYTACFFIVSRQPRLALKAVGWTGLVFSVFALVVTVAMLARY